MNPIIFGDSLYFAIETPVLIDGVETFFLSGTEGPFFFQVPDAGNVAEEWFFRWEDYAESFGGNLVTINTLDELNFLGSQYAQQSNESGVLTGLYENQSNEYVWTSGDVFSVPPSITGYPESFDSDGDRREDYIALYFKSTDGNDFSATEWNDVGAFSAMLPSMGIVEIPLNLSITTPSTPTEGAGVFAVSINLSAGTETSGNLAENAEIFWSISGITANDLEFGSLEGSGVIEGGELDINLALGQDDDTGESLKISVFSDSDRTQQIGETQSFEIDEGEVDPITGALGLPGKVNLKGQGKTPFVLYGNEELVFDPEVQDSLINPESLGFGLVPGETLFTAATKKNGTIHASYEDVDGYTYLDFVVKVDTPAIAFSELAAGEQDIFAFATINGGQDLLFTAPSAVFF